MLLGGLQKTSLTDYPDRISCIVFTLGCNFRCPFCQNANMVVKTEETSTISHKYFFDFLDSRKGLIDAVVITGGEPLLQKDLESFIRKVKKRGFLVKLDTNGSSPEILKDLIKKGLLDYIAMDIKSSLKNYEKACGIKVDTKKVKESAKIIMESGVDYEFRTTAVPNIHTQEDFEKIAEWLKGARKYFIQKFSNDSTLDKSFEQYDPFSYKEVEEVLKNISNNFNICELRGWSDGNLK